MTASLQKHFKSSSTSKHPGDSWVTKGLQKIFYNDIKCSVFLASFFFLNETWFSENVLHFSRCLFQITVTPYWNWLRLINKDGSLTTSALWAYCGSRPRRLWPVLNLLCPCSCCWSRTGTNRWNFTVIHRASLDPLLVSMCCDERGVFQVNPILFFAYLVKKVEKLCLRQMADFLIYHWEYFLLSFWCSCLHIGSVYFELSLRNWSVVRNHFVVCGRASDRSCASSDRNCCHHSNNAGLPGFTSGSCQSSQSCEWIQWFNHHQVVWSVHFKSQSDLSNVRFDHLKPLNVIELFAISIKFCLLVPDSTPRWSPSQPPWSCC